MLTPTALEGRVTFVTGSSRGIGRAIALALARAGADVALADVHPQRFEAERCYRLRQRTSGPDEDQPTAAAVAALGRRSLELRVNLSGKFHTVRSMAPAMAERGWGRVVNISSVAAITPGVGQPAYGSSKVGVVGFTKAVAAEFGPGGVTANAILPGLIATPLVRSMPAHLRERAAARSALGRLGEPDDIGNLAAFLASPAAGYISGVAVPCDGGLTYASRNSF